MEDFTSIDNFISEQLSAWPLARMNYEALATARQRSIDMGTYRVILQCNYTRRLSTLASVSAKDIAKRPCFLCADNRPVEQMALPFVSSDGLQFSILVNPYPIFSRHLTIVRDSHVPQQLLSKPCLSAMVELSWLLPDMAVFFNGAHCGASAPDHMHFQAADALQWPLFADFERANPRVLRHDDRVEVSCSVPGRLVYKIVGDDSDRIFDEMSDILKSHDRADDMVNVIIANQAVYVIPRKAFRPWQYSAQGDAQLLVSPASVEVGGILITPVEEHFNKITSDDVASIFSQVCFNSII